MKNYVILAATFGIGAAAGGGVTYLVTKKKLEKKFADIADEEIASVKKTYALMRKEPPYDDPATAAQAYIDRVQELEYTAGEAVETLVEETIEDAIDAVETAERTIEIAQELDDEDDEDDEDVSERPALLSNIFEEAKRVHAERSLAHSPEEFDELSGRDPHAPFRIPTVEFFDDSNEFSKITITYYEGDDTLADDRDGILPDIDSVIGRDAVHNFGADSDNKDIVYIRNEALTTDFEVVREEGSYAQLVLGVRDFRDKVPKIRKMRDDE